MTHDDVARLLAFLVSVDGRKLTDLSVDAWHEVLGDVDYGPALAAAREHYRSSRDWLMPADIIGRVRGAASGLPQSPPGRLASLPRRNRPAPEHVRAAITDLRRVLSERRREAQAAESAGAHADPANPAAEDVAADA